MTIREVRAWAKSLADLTRGRMPEYLIWDMVAERGREWSAAVCEDGSPDRGGPQMTPKECFRNVQCVVLGTVKSSHGRCRYAEGFALGYAGLWYHHAWAVNAAGLAVELTWDDAGERYIGVTVAKSVLGSYRETGCCQLTDWPLGTAWAPHMTAGSARRLFGEQGEVKLWNASPRALS
jgi:hypothetical protein